MIRHIVFFSARQPEDIEPIRAGLSVLGTIEHASHFEVAVNRKVDLFQNEIDIVVYAEFADEAALAAYKAHPVYAETTARVRPLREMRFAADFQAENKVPRAAVRPRSLVA